jgi:hypothetical protein
VIIWADGVVAAIRTAWPGAVELVVARRDGGTSEEVRALAYTTLTAVPKLGDRVLLNVAVSAPAATPW